ncbi:LANO_0G02960g1_1 [Lachancea nothofagi CBS 11611]|uniref:LANO_0G02960g1_1 n=1 Tax=Lachancea nothofagi CBS 11611 TaxID=1266666 RepID=A0A1G4KFN0_9SACH|nr:LANO_0G02960g1_1 [Lachancea nothofagi CBS 11611]
MVEEEKLSKSLEALAKVEDDVEVVEKEIELLRASKLAPIYESRKKAISGINGFWKVVLSQHSDFANYVRAGDLKYIDCIKSLDVKWLCVERKDADHRDFSATFEFEGIEGDFEAQSITKIFKIEHDTSKFRYRGKRTEEDDFRDEELGFLSSEPCEIKWPKSLDRVNPSLLVDKSSIEGKKNYRTGMKSFFSWFKWTGLKIGKEFPNGDGLASLLCDDIFPNCTKYYTEAQVDLEDENLEDEDLSDEPLQLDLSGSESDSEQRESDTKRQKL